MTQQMVSRRLHNCCPHQEEAKKKEEKEREEAAQLRSYSNLMTEENMRCSFNPTSVLNYDDIIIIIIFTLYYDSILETLEI